MSTASWFLFLALGLITGVHAEVQSAPWKVTLTECGVYEMRGFVNSKKEFVAYPGLNGERTFALSFDGPDSTRMALQVAELARGKNKAQPIFVVGKIRSLAGRRLALTVNELQLKAANPLNPMKESGFRLIRAQKCEKP